MSSWRTRARFLSQDWRRRVLGLLASVAIVLGGVVLPAQPAAAGVYASISSSAWAHTDSREPEAIFRDGGGDAPVGSWRDADGKHHKSRSYFTFDISRVHGTRILGAVGSLSETRVENCDVDRALEVWHTDPVTDTNSWREPPAERQRLYAIGPKPDLRCPAPYLEFGVVDAVRDALAAGQSTVTLALRVPDELEGDPNLGRWIKNRLHISVHYNTPPGIPTELQTSPGGACEAEGSGPYIPTAQPYLMARFSDSDEADRRGCCTIL